MERKTDKITLSLMLLTAIVLLSFFAVATPTGPSSINITSNETKAATSGTEINISGGYISKVNITASVQNPHWKAFVGWVNGQFTLDDASGSKIYEWSLSSIGGEVYATRNSSTISWSTIDCSNVTYLEAENTYLSFSSADDNISSTFDDTTHSTFVVGSTQITANTCPTLNTFVDNATQDISFEEVVLNDGVNNIFTTILEDDVGGYDGNNYDFQMLVPENASEIWSGATAYYLYVELS